VLKVSVAWRKPTAEGSKRTVNVVDEPPETGVEGCWVTEKLLAWAPEMLTFPRLRVPPPTLVTVNVLSTVPPCTSALPKSVSSSTEGVVSPSRMTRLLPYTSISAKKPPVPVPQTSKL
jgi:hypothetical protein